MDTNLDFSIIENGNCKTITIVDGSIYASGQTISEPKFTVYIPGFTDPVVVNMVPKIINVINSNNLNLTCTTDVNALTVLPDGIYKATYSIKPSATYSIEKMFLRTCKLECKFDNALLKLDMLNCFDGNIPNKIVKLREIEFLIMSAKAAANACNPKLALELYMRADKELNKIEAKCL
jgi:hypothetical protein